MAPLDMSVSTEVTATLIEKYKKALESFKEPAESELVKRADNSIRQHPSTDVEGYFEWVTRTGKSAVSWKLVKPVFLWKLKFVLNEMLKMEKEGFKIDKDTEFKLKFIHERTEEYDGPPFTFQRICELLITPTRHYKRFDKFVRALDKTVNVVTTVTEYGIRITGAEWPMPENPSGGKVEQHFFGKVDELDGLPPAGGSNIKRPSVEFSVVPIGPVIPSLLTPPSDDQPIDMSKRRKLDDEPKAPETAESKEGNLPVQSATDKKNEEAPIVDQIMEAGDTKPEQEEKTATSKDSPMDS